MECTIVSQRHSNKKRESRKGSSHGREDEKPRYHCKKSGHQDTECQFKDTKCFKWDKVGHIASTCKSKSRKKSGRQKQVDIKNTTDSENENMICAMEGDKTEKSMLEVKINRSTVKMEVDTGAAVMIIPKGICKIKLHKALRKLKSVTGEPVKLEEQALVTVQVGKIKKHLTVYVAEDENCPALFGCDWIAAFFGSSWIHRLTKNLVARVTESTDKPSKL